MCNLTTFRVLRLTHWALRPPPVSRQVNEMAVLCQSTACSKVERVCAVVSTVVLTSEQQEGLGRLDG
jgi:hypothetical protein